MTQYYNPFAGIYLVYPVEQEPEYHRYCQTGGHEPIDQSPFGRMVDLWFAGLSVATRKGLSPIDLHSGGGVLDDLAPRVRHA